MRKNWDEYDAFVLAPEPAGPEDSAPSAPTVPAPSAPGNPPADVPADAKAISAARKFLSTGKARLKGMTNAEEDEEIKQQYVALLAEMQTRLDWLIATNAGISDRQLAELKALGLNT